MMEEAGQQWQMDGKNGIGKEQSQWIQGFPDFGQW